MVSIDTATLKAVMPGFKKWLKTEGQELTTERQEGDAFFAQYFARQELDKLDEGTLRLMIRTLWAFSGWTNKEWLLQQMLASGLPDIRKAFDELLYGTATIADRFDSFKGRVRMVGAASISEILAHVEPNEYPFWNRRSRNGLIALGVNDSLLPKASQISGSQYSAFAKLAREVLAQVSQQYEDFDDLLTLDFLLFYLSLHNTGVQAERAGSKELSHGEVMSQVAELGDGLGFDVQTEVSLSRGCRIDVIWRSRVANLGTIAYAFEVHNKGSRDSAILNLQRVGRDPSIQKVIIVSTADELAAVRDEIATLDSRFVESVGYFEVDDLRQATEHLEALKTILNTLGLLRRRESSS